MARTNRDVPRGVSYEGSGGHYRVILHGRGIGFVARVAYGRASTRWVARGWGDDAPRLHGATRDAAATALVESLPEPT